eukprot:6208273-Pleurochrysis_carterae.AAC.1
MHERALVRHLAAAAHRRVERDVVACGLEDEAQLLLLDAAQQRQRRGHARWTSGRAYAPPKAGAYLFPRRRANH